MTKRRLVWTAGIVLSVVLAGAMFAWTVNEIGVPPRRLAPYIEQRTEGHSRAIAYAGARMADLLMALDRGRSAGHWQLPVPPRIGSGSVPPGVAGIPRMPVSVATVEEAKQAIAGALPGDTITFAPGTYRFRDGYVDVRRPGAPGAPITVRAAHTGSVVLEFDMLEGFLVSAPYWTFEDLTIRGVCADDSNCEHAFHVVAGATHFIARDNTITDFNAQFKINASAGYVPDFGLIENNVLADTRARQTGNPVVKIDLVAASHWRIVGNRISDFVKAGGDRISTGAFAKGGGADNRFERNIVVCEDRLRNLPGQRVGLSLGGGGTGQAYCRDGKCDNEQEAGVIESNLIASCSDDGIYLNRAAASRIIDNTLIDTGGITLRFPESSAEVAGNLVDGAIRSKAGALLHATDNRDTGLTWLYLGWHPVRRLFDDALALDLGWRGAPPHRDVTDGDDRVPVDLCGSTPPSRPVYGAFEDIHRCFTPSR